MKKRMVIMLAATAAVIVVVFGGKFWSMKQKFMNRPPPPPTTISSARAETMQWSNEIVSVGSIVPLNGTEVTAETSGIVSSILFEPGSRVSGGTLLIELESAAERAELDRLRAQAEVAELDAERAADLLARKVISRAEFDTANATAAAAQAAVDAQAAKLAQKQIRAPFSGVLGIRRVSLGDYLSPGQAIVTLQAVDPIEVEFALPEHDYSRVKAGLPIRVSVDAYPGKAFPGELTVIEPRVQGDTRNFRMRGRLPNPEGKLRAGMFARVDILRPGTDEVVAIPRTAVNYDSYGSSVFLIEADEEKDGKLVARHRFIRTGRARGDFISVLEGLEPGDEVVSSGLLKLRNGAAVQVDNSNLPDLKLDAMPADT